MPWYADWENWEAMFERLPGLIEVGVGHRTGHPPARLLVWHTLRIGAVLCGDGITVFRRLGRIDGDHEVRLTSASLQLLDAAARHWAMVRDEWAAFYVTAQRWAPRVVHSYRPPGRSSLPREVYMSAGSVKRGRPFTGHDVERALPRPVRVLPGLFRVADRWERQRQTGPRMGVKVGEVYRLRDGARL